MESRRLHIFSYLSIFFIFLTTFLFSAQPPKEPEHPNTTNDRLRKSSIIRKSGSLTRPLLDFELELTEDETLKVDIQTIIDKKKKEGLISASIYFMDLNTGIGFAINEKEKFTPRSLLKVPIMISALKEEEMKPGFLKTQIPYTSILSQDYDGTGPAGPRIKYGETYTVEDLLYRAIVYSDNNATLLLKSNIDNEILSTLYRDLGIANPYYDISRPDRIL
jgi:beta-lactamase class A